MEYFINAPDEMDVLPINSRDRIKYNCRMCDKITSVRFRPCDIQLHKLLLCRPCHLAKHNREHPEKYETVKQNLLNTKGVENVSQLPEVKIKVKNSMDERWGGYTLSSPILRSKVEDSCLKKFGLKNPYAFGTVFFEAMMLDLYGGYTLASPILKDKTMQTIKEVMDETYGQPYYIHSEDFDNKMIDKYGTTTPYAFGTEEFSKLMIEKYGVEHFPQVENFSELISYLRELDPMKFQSKKYVFNNISLDSFPEFAIYIYCIDFCVPIYRNEISLQYFDSKGCAHYTYPDFIICRNLIEIKGDHFFRPNGTMYCPYRRPEWDDERYEYECSKYEAKRQCLINNGVIILKTSHPWVQICIQYVLSRYGIAWVNMFSKFEPNNFCYGFTPYNIDKESEYQHFQHQGLTPFNLGPPLLNLL